MPKIVDKLKQLKKAREEADDQQHVVALDIGTEYIKALIARLEDDKLIIVGAGRAHQQVSDMHSGAIADIAGVVQNCEQALAEAEAEINQQLQDGP